MKPGLFILLVVGVLFFGWFWFQASRQSLNRADEFELSSGLERWIEAGSPQGESLSEFMRGRRRDFVFTNRVFNIFGTNCSTIFALTNSKSGHVGTLFITTNKDLIWLDLSEVATLRKPTPKNR
jgi:hypothetical protein